MHLNAFFKNSFMKSPIAFLYTGFLFCILLIGCKKDNANTSSSSITILRDTTIVLKAQDTIPIRVSFVSGQYLDFTFIGNISEGRCPTCVNGQTDTCPHYSTADVNFVVKNELGETYTYLSIFNSCVIERDTSTSGYFIPFYQKYKIYPLKLAPYPTDLNNINWSAYTLKIYVKQT